MNSGRTPLFLMANLGSEVSRLLSAHEQGATLEGRRALERTERIIASIETSGISKEGLAEVEILKKVIKDVCSKEPTFSVSPKALRDYFLPFAKRVLEQT